MTTTTMQAQKLMRKGAMPMARILRMLFILSFQISFWKWMRELLRAKCATSQITDMVCPAICAQAAPYMPQPHQKMKMGEKATMPRAESRAVIMAVLG